jgi:hypothetical protein
MGRKKGDWYYECHATIFNDPSHVQNCAFDFEATVSANSWEEAEPKFWKALERGTKWRITDKDVVERRPADRLEWVWVYPTGIPRTKVVCIFDRNHPESVEPHPVKRRMPTMEEIREQNKRYMPLVRMIGQMNELKKEALELREILEGQKFTEGMMGDDVSAKAAIDKFLEQTADSFKILLELRGN